MKLKIDHNQFVSILRPDTCPCLWQKFHPLATIRSIVSTFCASVILTGCVTAPNGFNQFYEDKAGNQITNLPPYSGSTRIVTTSNPTNDIRELYRNGYALIGVAAFQGPPQSDAALLSQAKKVGADVVLLSSAYLGSEQVAVPLVQYSPGQTYTTTSSGVVTANILSTLSRLNAG